MFGTPFTCTSIGAATDCSMVAASAPGKVAETTTEGGVICGKRATGNNRKATSPASVMTIASTVAKIGRSKKKLLTTSVARPQDRPLARPQERAWRGAGLA